MTTNRERDLESLQGDLDRLEAIVAEWESNQRGTVNALRSTVEAIQAEAFRRLIRTVKEDPAGLEALQRAVADPVVFAVLSYHGLLKSPAPSLEDRVEAALESVRPTLAGHAGNVSLVKVVSEREVHIRLEGSCDGCAFSDATVTMGIETAIKEAVPTVEVVKVTNGKKSSEASAAADGLVQLPTGARVDESPFEAQWEDAAAFDELAEGKVVAAELKKASVILTRVGDEPRAYPNACTHLGLPLDDGQVEGGVLECAYHGFRYALATGECLTAPDVALPRYPAQVRDGRVLVQVKA